MDLPPLFSNFSLSSSSFFPGLGLGQTESFELLLFPSYFIDRRKSGDPALLFLIKKNISSCRLHEISFFTSVPNRIRKRISSIRPPNRDKCGDISETYSESYYNLCRKRGALKGKTPAQAAGLTNHPLTLREWLTYNAVITSKISQGVTYIIERRCDDTAPSVLSAREPGKASDLPGGTARYCPRL